MEVEERVAVARAGRMEQPDHHVALEAEGREVVRLGLRAADGGGRADDVGLVDVLGPLGARLVGASRAAGPFTPKKTSNARLRRPTPSRSGGSAGIVAGAM